MQRFSLLSLLTNALTDHQGWKPFWRDAAPKPRYDAIIIGGGGHGLATAYYLAKNHGMKNVAVLELPVEERPDFSYMYHAGTHLMPIVNGQSGFFPPWYEGLQKAAAAFPTTELLDTLRKQGVTHVIAHRRWLGGDGFDRLRERAVARTDLELRFRQNLAS